MGGSKLLKLSVGAENGAFRGYLSTKSQHAATPLKTELYVADLSIRRTPLDYMQILRIKQRRLFNLPSIRATNTIQYRYLTLNLVR